MNGIQPWESQAVQKVSWLGVGPSGNLIDDGRPFVVVPGSVERVWAESCSDDLPCFVTWKDDLDFEWKRFELPATARQTEETDENGVSEETRVILTSHAAPDTELGVSLRFQLPRLPRNDRSDNSPLADGQEQRIRSRWIDASETVEDLIDRHIDLISALFDSAEVTGSLWQGNAQGVAFRRSDELASRWHRSAVSGEPRMALIVRLARTLPELLAKTCNRPRHTLRRERQLQFIGQIQEIDSSCLRWLARQPGTTVAEKAGVKQMAMAVVRVEDVDTPENRVVRDLLIRGAYACDRYLREHRSASEHPRVVQVERFRHLLRELLFTTRIAEAGKLVGIPQQNYVLQHDPRYQVLWQAYLQLVHQQMLEDSVWQWRHRLFAEHFTICLIAALEECSELQQQHRGDVLLQLEQNAGQFIDPRTTLGPWRLKNRQDDNVDLVLGFQLRQHPMIPERLAAIGPDVVLVRRSSTGQPWLAAFWTLLDFDLAQDLLDDRVLSLSEAIEELGDDAPQRALMIQPVITGEAARFIDLEKSRGVRIGLPLQYHFAQIVEHVKWTLGLN